MTAPVDSSGQFSAQLAGLQASSTNLTGLAGQSSSTASDLGSTVLNALSFAQIGSTVGAANTSLQSGLTQALGKVSDLLKEVGQLVGVSGQNYAEADQQVASSLGSSGQADPNKQGQQDPPGWNPTYKSPNPHPQKDGGRVSVKVKGKRVWKATYDMTGQRPPASAPDGTLDDWISQAKVVLKDNGVDTSSMTDADLRYLIMHESSGKWDQLNNWDTNAAAGMPSKGLMQVIDPTFNKYSVPGHRDIWNPVDNIVAGVNYGIAKYGGFDRINGVASHHKGGPYRPY